MAKRPDHHAPAIPQILQPASRVEVAISVLHYAFALMLVSRPSARGLISVWVTPRAVAVPTIVAPVSFVPLTIFHDDLARALAPVLLP